MLYKNFIHLFNIIFLTVLCSLFSFAYFLFPLFYTGTSHDKHVPPASSDKLHLILPRISVTFPTTKMPATFSRFIHVKHPGSPARIFRETTV